MRSKSSVSRFLAMAASREYWYLRREGTLLLRAGRTRPRAPQAVQERAEDTEGGTVAVSDNLTHPLPIDVEDDIFAPEPLRPHDNPCLRSPHAQLDRHGLIELDPCR